MHDGMPYDMIRGQGQGHGAISSAIYNGSWQMTTDSKTTAQYLNLIRLDFCYLS